jgi:hypothetical protein
LSADHLLAHSTFDQLAGGAEVHAADRQRTEIRNADRPVTRDGQRHFVAVVAEQFHVQHVARAEHVVRRHGDVGAGHERVRA